MPHYKNLCVNIRLLDKKSVSIAVLHKVDKTIVNGLYFHWVILWDKVGFSPLTVIPSKHVDGYPGPGPSVGMVISIVSTACHVTSRWKNCFFLLNFVKYCFTKSSEKLPHMSVWTFQRCLRVFLNSQVSITPVFWVAISNCALTRLMETRLVRQKTNVKKSCL